MRSGGRKEAALFPPPQRLPYTNSRLFKDSFLTPAQFSPPDIPFLGGYLFALHLRNVFLHLYHSETVLLICPKVRSVSPRHSPMVRSSSDAATTTTGSSREDTLSPAASTKGSAESTETLINVDDAVLGPQALHAPGPATVSLEGKQRSKRQILTFSYADDRVPGGAGGGGSGAGGFLGG